MPYYYSPLRHGYEEKTAPKPKPDCPFCTTEIENQTFRDHQDTLFENEHYRWVANWFPRAEAHTMLVPKRHLTQLVDETDTEILARHNLLLECYQVLQTAFPDSGVEVFLQTGKGSLSSLPHLHWNVIPTLPQHSLTGFEKIGYFSTTEPAKEKVVMTPIEITIARDQLLELITKTTAQM